MPEDRSEFIHPPRWRTRTPEGRVLTMNAFTFAAIVAVGSLLLVLVVRGLDRVGAPTWLGVLAWALPTGSVLVWALWRPEPADRHDDDQSWVDYTVRRVMVGDGRRRSRPERAITGVVFGGPVGVVLVIGIMAEILGVV